MDIAKKTEQLESMYDQKKDELNKIEEDLKIKVVGSDEFEIGGTSSITAEILRDQHSN